MGASSPLKAKREKGRRFALRLLVRRKGTCLPWGHTRRRPSRKWRYGGLRFRDRAVIWYTLSISTSQIYCKKNHIADRRRPHVGRHHENAHRGRRVSLRMGARRARGLGENARITPRPRSE